MCELFQYSSQNYHPSTQKALSYLEVCNSIFEKGFLSHQVIKSMESDVLKSIDEGYFLQTGCHRLFRTVMVTYYWLSINLYMYRSRI